ncbi:hypothetical protein F5X99DRAFT_382832 [Biscogniauxia marginata]|nr:hypothetical protein F5X99DRAFT_382832 [Biscogniauxia marginata]
MDQIPPEIVLHIFKFLDEPAPSEMRLHDQPGDEMLDVDSESSCPLKTVSLVSKSWRTLVLPILFRHVLWRPKVFSLSAFTLNPIPLLRFLEDNRLDHSVISFTLLVNFFETEADAYLVTPKIRTADLEWLWDQIFSVIDPLRFTIIARPTTLAALLSRMLFLVDAWSFDIPYHILSLARASRGANGKISPDETVRATESAAWGLRSPETDVLGASQSGAVTTTSSGRLPSTSRRTSRTKKPPACPLFTVRPWTSVLLNEGSSTRVYRMYEFFLRRPPSMLGALLGCEDHPNDAPLIPPSVVDFNYIAIFPLSSHFETLLQNLPKVERLFVQLTPKAGNKILEDEDAMKHIDPADLWMERNTSYSFLMREMTFMPTPPGNWATLRVFESGDAADRESWDLAVQLLESSGIKGWKVEREGVFAKHVEGENDPDWESEVNGHHGGANIPNTRSFQGALRRIAFNGVAHLPFTSMWFYMRDVDLSEIDPDHHLWYGILE